MSTPCQLSAYDATSRNSSHSQLRFDIGPPAWHGSPHILQHVLRHACSTSSFVRIVSSISPITPSRHSTNFSTAIICTLHATSIPAWLDTNHATALHKIHFKTDKHPPQHTPLCAHMHYFSRPHDPVDHPSAPALAKTRPISLGIILTMCPTCSKSRRLKLDDAAARQPWISWCRASLVEERNSEKVFLEDRNEKLALFRFRLCNRCLE